MDQQREKQKEQCELKDKEIKRLQEVIQSKFES